MSRKDAGCRVPKSLTVKAWYLAALCTLLSGYMVACNLPFQSSSSSAPTIPPTPPPGKTLYVLDAFSNLQKATATSPVKLAVVALRASTGQRLWQSSLVTLPAEDVGNARIASGGSILYVSISAPETQGPHVASAKVNGMIIAVDAVAGKVRWTAGIDGAIIQHITPVANGDLYMQVDNRVEALDGRTGGKLWSAPTDANYRVTQLVVTNSAAYVEQEAYFLPAGGIGNTYDSAIVRALRLGDGRQVWRQEVANSRVDGLLSLVRVSMQADAQSVYLLRVGQVQEAHGVVAELVPRMTLFALRAPDGSPLWSDPTQAGDVGADFDLLLFGKTLYARGVVSPGQSSLTAFQTLNGSRLWSWQTPFVLNPFEPPNHIYGSTLNHGESFWALRSSDGSKAWCAPYNQAGPVVFGGPGTICLVAFKVSYQGTSESEQPAQLYILNESDGDQVAQYSPGPETSATILSLALS
jgi:outer membrane protein assembly factor BamB